MKKLYENDQNSLIRKVDIKKYLLVLIYFVLPLITISTGFLLLLKLLIPTYAIISGSRSRTLITFFFIAPFAIAYTYMIYTQLYKKVAAEFKLKQNIIKSLRRTEERYRALFNSASDAVLIHAVDGHIIDANLTACDMLNYSRDEIIQLNIKEIEASQENNSQYVYANQMQNTFCETEYSGKNGTVIPVEVNSSYIEYNNITAVMVIARNIVERKKAEEQLFIYQKQLRSLAAKLSFVQEEERRKIAVDLHDFIGQNLAISKIKLQLILHENKNQPQVQEVLGLIEQTIPFIRNLTTILSPTILYDLSFKSALEWLGEHFQKHYKMDVILSYDEQLKNTILPENIKVILFQSARELLMNTVKHSKAHCAYINVNKEGEYFTVCVEDNGIGFDYTKLFHTFDNQFTFGLFSVKERIEYAGGIFQVESEPGKFTKVNLKIPIN